MHTPFQYCTVGQRDQLPQLLSLIEDLWAVCDTDWWLTVYTDDLMVERVLRQIPRPRLTVSRVPLGTPEGLSPSRVLHQHVAQHHGRAIIYLDPTLHLIRAPQPIRPDHEECWRSDTRIRYWYVPENTPPTTHAKPVQNTRWCTLTEALQTRNFSSVTGFLTEGLQSQATDIFTVPWHNQTTLEALTGPIYSLATALNRAWVWLLGCEPGYPCTPPSEDIGPVTWYATGQAQEWLAQQSMNQAYTDAQWCIVTPGPVTGTHGVRRLPTGPKPQRFTQEFSSQQQHPVIVSAIVSTYDAEHHFEGCLNDLIAQTLFQVGQLEIIIIDSHSTQKEADIAKAFVATYPNIRYARTPHREGVYQAWNRGISMARGRYITNANTDDRHHPNALAVMAQMLEEHPEVGLVYGQCYSTRLTNETWDTHTPSQLIDPIPVTRNTLAQINSVGPQPMWRKALHERAGFFDARYTVAGDYEMWLRFLTHAPFHKLDGVTGIYFQGDESVEHSNAHRCHTETASIALNWRHWHTEELTPPLLLLGP